MEALQFLQNNWFEIVTAITYVVTGASIITKFTKNTWDDKIVGKILNFLALVPKPK